MKVFLGGTVADSTWREYIMPKLEIDYFNPVVEVWTEEDQKREVYERENSEFCLYVLTPKLIGWYSFAEVIDDSYKKPDYTIYCYLPEDEDKKFTPQQILEVEQIGKMVTANGGIWLKSLDEIVTYLNSANQRDETLVHETHLLNNVFISYGRRHSIALARKLYNSLKDAKLDVWFDMNDIPLGVDFQEQIDEGIKKADNFIFVISPHSVKSVYCYKEIILALKYNKRIIPILHIEPTDSWDKMHPVIGKLNWIYLRQTENFNIPLEKWEFADDYDTGVTGLISLINLQNGYVRQHTELLDKTIVWTDNQKSNSYLLQDEEYNKSYKWLKRKEFKNETGAEIQAPCLPTALHAEFITESKKSIEYYTTNSFIAYSKEDTEAMTLIRNSLNINGKTNWTDTNDIKSGTKFDEAFEKGVIESTNLLFLISPSSIKSDICLQQLELADKYNKRIIPLLIEETEISEMPAKLQSVQHINFIDRSEREEVKVENHDDVEADIESRKGKTPFEKSVDKLIKQLETDKEYYVTHKILLINALQWKKEPKDSLLLRGFQFENAKIWLALGKEKQNKPLPLHNTFIEKSAEKSGISTPEVFISYSRKDNSAVRRLNHHLNKADKITWFDQESIPDNLDYKEEVRKGIEQAENFLFVISPNSIISPNCISELDFAFELNKRIITLLITETDPEIIPQDLAKIKWIDASKKDSDIAFHELLQVLNNDREYIKKHTYYAKEAIQWDKNNRDESILLSGKNYSEASKWFTESENDNKEPQPSELQKQWLESSRKTINRKRRSQIISTAVFVVVALLSVWAIFNSYQANKQKTSIQEMLSQVEILSNISEEHNNGEFLNAQVLITSLDEDIINQSSPEIYRMISEFINEITHKIIEKNHFKLEANYVSIEHNKATRRLLAADENGNIHILNKNGEFLHKWKSGGERIKVLTWTKNGEHVVGIVNDSNLVLWTDKGEVVSTNYIIPDTYLLEINSKGNQIATANLNEDYIQIWEAVGGKLKITKEIPYEQFYKVTDETMEELNQIENLNISVLMLDRIKDLKHKNAVPLKQFKKYLEEIGVGENIDLVCKYAKTRVSLDYRSKSDDFIYTIGTTSIFYYTEGQSKLLVNTPGQEYKQVVFKSKKDIIAVSNQFIYYYHLDGEYIGLYESNDKIGDVKFCSCGHTLAYLSDTRINIIESGEYRGFLSSTDYEILAYDHLSVSGELITVESDSTLRIWDLQKFTRPTKLSANISNEISYSKVWNLNYLQTHRDEFPDSASYYKGIVFPEHITKVENTPKKTTNNIYAFTFDGLTDYICADYAASVISEKEEFSIAGWIYPKKSNKGTKNISGIFGFKNEYNCDFYLEQSENDEIIAGFRNSNKEFFTFTAGELKLDQWQHIALTYNGMSINLFVDGKKVASTFAVGKIHSHNTNFYIGAIRNQRNFLLFNGLIDEVSIWDKELTDKDLTQIMTIVPITDENLRCYWSFDTPGINILEQISGFYGLLFPHRTCNL